MLRKIIRIDEENCNGCGKCATACHEGAIGIVNGKATLLREDYCDGLGDCLPACPMDAISFEEREAPAYDEAAVLKAKAQKEQAQNQKGPSSFSKAFGNISRASGIPTPGRLQNFPIQLKLVPTYGPVYDRAHLLVAADCTGYACGDFHERFLTGKTAVIGCPKLDQINYAEKLTEILAMNTIQSVTLVRMQVPCCGALERALKAALEACEKSIPLETFIVTQDGRILK